MITKIFIILGKAKLNTGNTNDSNLAEVRLTIALMSKPPHYNISIICCTEPGLMKACE